MSNLADLVDKIRKENDEYRGALAAKLLTAIREYEAATGLAVRGVRSIGAQTIGERTRTISVDVETSADL